MDEDDDVLLDQAWDFREQVSNLAENMTHKIKFMIYIELLCNLVMNSCKDPTLACEEISAMFKSLKQDMINQQEEEEK